MNRAIIFLVTFLFSVFLGTPLYCQNQVIRDIPKDDPAAILKIAAENYKNPEQVIQLSNQALALLSTSEKQDLAAKAYHLIGKSNYALNHFGSAIDYYKRSELIFARLNDSTSLAGVLNNIGDCYQMKSEYRQAAEYLQKALKISEKIKNNRLNASILNNLGIVYQLTGQYEQSLDCLNKALKLFEEFGDKNGSSSAQNNIGLTYSQLGKYEEALVWFNKAIYTKKETGDTLNLANTFESLGQVHEKIENYSKAIEYYSESLRLQKLIRNSNGIAVDYTSLARVNMKLKNFQKAFEYLTISEKIAVQVENNIAIKDNYQLLSDYYLAIGNPYQSREMMLRYAMVNEKIFNMQVSDRLAEMTIQYETDQKEYENKLLQANLEIEKIKLNRSRYLQFLYIIISVILSSLFIYTLYLLRKLSINKVQIEQFNIDLNKLNLELEEKVIERTMELSTALKKAEESDKLKSAFLANMSHEVRTPMNGILGFAKILENDDTSSEDRKRYLEVINHQGRSLLQIINDIISLSKIETGQMEIKNTVCNVNKILDDLFLIFNEPNYLNRKNGITLKVVKSVGDNECNIVTDPGRVEQVLINLIDNAHKFTSVGEVEFGYSIENHNTLKFFVKDTGFGIPEDQLEKIFDRFYRYIQYNQPSPRGAGLGLSISKRLANLLRGNLLAESKQNKGSQFYFTIPFIAADSHIDNTSPRPEMKITLHHWPDKTVLVVEDDLISYQYIAALLQGTGLKLIHAKSGEDAVSICISDEKIDLVLMDIQLPFMSGYVATQKIKAIRENLPIIAQTANVLNNEKNLTILAGCTYYISKPIDPDELYDAISNCLNSTAF